MTTPTSKAKLKNVLERLYARYNRKEFIGSDPLQFAYRYTDQRDIEIGAFFAAALAYGRVEQIHKSLTDLFARMGASPFEFAATFSESRRAKLRSFKHRFTTGDDISDLLTILKPVLNKHGSLESFFAKRDESSEKTILPALARFCDALSGEHPSRGLMYLLASPSRNSASKRLNLFLRWMVRKDDVDLGLWTSIDKSRLIVPVDTHIARLCRLIGLCEANTISRSIAVKITEAFASIDPSDPVKYDFALSRIGIVESCTGRYRSECPLCELHGVCLAVQNFTRRAKD